MCNDIKLVVACNCWSLESSDEVVVVSFVTERGVCYSSLHHSHLEINRWFSSWLGVLIRVPVFFPDNWITVIEATSGDRKQSWSLLLGYKTMLVIKTFQRICHFFAFFLLWGILPFPGFCFAFFTRRSSCVAWKKIQVHIILSQWVYPIRRLKAKHQYVFAMSNDKQQYLESLQRRAAGCWILRNLYPTTTSRVQRSQPRSQPLLHEVPSKVAHPPKQADASC